MPPLLVQICQQLPNLGLLPPVAESEGDRQHGGNGPIRRPGNHHLHRPQHPLHGNGALPHDQGVQQRALGRKSGEDFELLSIYLFGTALDTLKCYEKLEMCRFTQILCQKDVKVLRAERKLLIKINKPCLYSFL